MAKLTYWQKLKDPRWQKKRLEVMQEKDFCCEVCGDAEETLNVHHKEYFKGLEPWEYGNNQLAVLCESCHESMHDKLDLLKWICSQARLDGPENREELAFLLGGYMGIPYKVIIAFSCLDDYPWLKRVYDAGVTANEISNKNLKCFNEGEKIG